MFFLCEEKNRKAKEIITPSQKKHQWHLQAKPERPKNPRRKVLHSKLSQTINTLIFFSQGVGD